MTRLAPLLSALWCLALASCIDLPRSTVPQSPSDRAAMDAARAAFESARGEAGRSLLDGRVDVISLPVDGQGSAPTIRAKCMRPASACYYVVQRYVGAPPSIVMYVRDDADARTRAALVIHESLHILRGAWIEAAASDPYGEYRRRWRHGEREDCPIPWGPDLHHCDRELWATIERAAIARWERGR